MRVHAHAPGRVNLIGEHTDYTGGLALPFAIDLGTTIDADIGGDVVHLRSTTFAEPAVVPLDTVDRAAVTPRWATYVAAAVAEVRPTSGLVGTVHSTVPMGAGLSSSAALTVSAMLALGFEGGATELALACQRAETRATNVRGGVLDHIASVCGVPGCALLLDCTTLDVQPVPLPPEMAVVVVHSGQQRVLADSGYAHRRAECEAVERLIGPLRHATDADVQAITDPVLRRRARHVVSENRRVPAFVACMRSGDLRGAGELLNRSHVSLRDDYEVSTTVVDQLVDRLAAVPGVFGCRIMGGGFGGAVVALAEHGAVDVGWVLAPVGGARRWTSPET